ncbi:MAG: FAD-dependent oxidoreductase, partial [Pseudomonadota bacterium]
RNVSALADAAGASLARGPGWSRREGLAPGFAWLTEKFSADQTAALSELAFASAVDAIAAQIGDPALAAALCFEAVFGSTASPSAPGSAIGFARRLAGDANAAKAGGCPAGGMGAFAEALRRAAEKSGVDIRTGVDVAGVLVEWDAAAGIQMSDGGQLRAPVVVSALNAQRTYAELLGPDCVDLEIADAFSSSRPAIGAAKMHIALKNSPEFYGAERSDLIGRLLLLPDLSGLEAAFSAAKRGEAPEAPPMEIIIPSAHDADMAADGRHVVSAMIYPAPYAPGKDIRKRLLRRAYDALAKAAPTLRENTLTAELRTGADLEADYGACEAPFRAAPPLSAQWFTAGSLEAGGGVDGFFFCGPEVNLSARLSGAPGRQAARAAVKYARRRG